MKMDEFKAGQRVFIMAKTDQNVKLTKYNGTVGEAWKKDGNFFVVKLDNGTVLQVDEESAGCFELEPLN
jgi:hypothetical protein